MNTKTCAVRLPFIRTAAAAAVLILFFAFSAWAGEWVQSDEGTWIYEEDGVRLTGWNQIDGLWYYMDAETGIWNPKPKLDDTAVCYLLENEVEQAGWYRSETSPIHYNVSSSNARYATVSLLVETVPNFYSTTLGTFKVDRSTGIAKEESTRLTLDLYSY